jgi:hypothetical protein
MTRVDESIERAAEKLERASASAAARGGLLGRAAAELSQDAAFLRKLKPSLIRARARGQAVPTPAPAAPATPQLPRRAGAGNGSPNPLLVVGLALAGGIVLAKAIDWRSHAHPRR